MGNEQSVEARATAFDPAPGGGNWFTMRGCSVVTTTDGVSQGPCESLWAQGGMTNSGKYLRAPGLEECLAKYAADASTAPTRLYFPVAGGKRYVPTVLNIDGLSREINPAQLWAFLESRGMPCTNANTMLEGPLGPSWGNLPPPPSPSAAATPPPPPTPPAPPPSTPLVGTATARFEPDGNGTYGMSSCTVEARSATSMFTMPCATAMPHVTTSGRFRKAVGLAKCLEGATGDAPALYMAGLLFPAFEGERYVPTSLTVGAPPGVTDAAPGFSADLSTDAKLRDFLTRPLASSGLGLKLPGSCWVQFESGEPGATAALLADSANWGATAEFWPAGPNGAHRMEGCTVRMGPKVAPCSEFFKKGFDPQQLYVRVDGMEGCLASAHSEAAAASPPNAEKLAGTVAFRGALPRDNRTGERFAPIDASKDMQLQMENIARAVGCKYDSVRVRTDYVAADGGGGGGGGDLMPRPPLRYVLWGGSILVALALVAGIAAWALPGRRRA